MSSYNYLSEAKENSIVAVKSIEAGYRANKFLADLGIHEGEKLRIIKNDSGPIIVEIKGTRVAIGRGLARKISIKRE